MHIIELTERVRKLLPESELTPEDGEALWRIHRNKISVEPPSFRTAGLWEIVSLGWVGYIPLSPRVGFTIHPKVPIGNVFRMLEYAYRLRTLEFSDRLIDCQSLQEFYEQLAVMLAKRILDRGRKGFARDYLTQTERLPYVTGRLDTKHAIAHPWDPNPRCHYEEHTADIEDNQILAWTLSLVLRSGMCSERAMATVRQAYRAVQSVATMVPVSPEKCVGRFYNRLNLDYQPLHALCRFFLEHSGPSQVAGQHAMLPFLVNMDRLYELFVAEWLRLHLPSEYYLKPQEQVDVLNSGELVFRIDLVLYRSNRDRPVWVLDTKYKAPEKISGEDVSQVITYAAIKKSPAAALVYPTTPRLRVDEQIGGIAVRSLVFALDGDLEAQGDQFLADLLSADHP